MRKHMTGPRLLLALALAALAASLAPALEAKEGLVKIIVNEATARVSIFRLIDVAKGRYEAFIFDQDPRTSFATLSIDGRQARLGDSAEFRPSATRTDTGVLVEFRSASCVVRQSVDFARSEGAALADGVRVVFEIENVGQKDALIGLRYLVDTWLAEKSGQHFRTDRAERILEETVISRDGAERWVATPGERAELMLWLGEGAERPDRVVLANWKRLNDAPWSLEAAPSRSFTLLPYSINDSAAAVYWEPLPVARSATRKLVLHLGAFNEKGYGKAVAAPGAGSTEAIFAQTALSGGQADPRDALAADIVAVRDLVTRIDLALSSGAPSAEEVAAWRKILDILEERKKGY